MNGGSRPRGFTIVETLIVLAVTSFLFVVVSVLISGKQTKTEFSTGYRDLESRFQKVIDDVSSGYYPNTGTFACDEAGGAPNITTAGGGAQQGTNKDCLFLGKAIQFKVHGSSPETFNVYSVAGLRENSSGQAVADLNEANPRLITVAGAYDTQTLPFGMTTQWVKYNNVTTVGAVAFLSNLGNVDTQGPSQQVDVYPVPGTATDQPMANTVAAVEAPGGLKSAPADPNGGVQVCISSGGTNQSALYNFGGVGRQLTVAVTIKNGTVC